MTATVAAHVQTGALVITLTGRWGLTRAHTLQRIFARCLARCPAYVAVDCARVGTGAALPALLPSLVMLGGSCRRGVTVLVCAPTSVLTRLLRRMPTRRLRLYPRLAEALQSVRPHHVPVRVHRAHRRFAPTPQAAGSARRLVRECCERWGLRDAAGTGQLVVSELVANAVEHAGTDIDLTLCHDGGLLRIAVADRLRAIPEVTGRLPAAGGSAAPRAGEPLSLRGRGLAMVTRSVAGCGVLGGIDGKVVWADVPVSRTRRARLRELPAAGLRAAGRRG